MSIERRVTIHCDGHGLVNCCRREFPIALTSSTARFTLASEGWTTTGKRDFCPGCTERRAQLRNRSIATAASGAQS